MNSWRKNQSLDHLYTQAKTDGYRARSAYKLLEIQKKFKLIQKNSSVLDLGCAPGSWMQVASQFTQNIIIGIDLLPITPVRNTHFIQADFTNTSLVTKLLASINAPEKFDIILSDMSHNISGDRDSDHYKSIELLELVYEFSKSYLKQNGTIVYKLFDGIDTQMILKKLRSVAKVSIFKPIASRPDSREIYVILEKRSRDI